MVYKVNKLFIFSLFRSNIMRNLRGRKVKRWQSQTIPRCSVSVRTWRWLVTSRITGKETGSSTWRWCGQLNSYMVCIGYSKNPKDLNTRKIVVIILKFEPCGFTIHIGAQKMQTEWQTVLRLLLQGQSNQGLHCLPRPVRIITCLHILHYFSYLHKWILFVTILSESYIHIYNIAFCEFHELHMKESSWKNYS